MKLPWVGPGVVEEVRDRGSLVWAQHAACAEVWSGARWLRRGGAVGGVELGGKVGLRHEFATWICDMDLQHGFVTMTYRTP